MQEKYSKLKLAYDLQVKNNQRLHAEKEKFHNSVEQGVENFTSLEDRNALSLHIIGSMRNTLNNNNIFGKRANGILLALDVLRRYDDNLIKREEYL